MFGEFENIINIFFYYNKLLEYRNIIKNFCLLIK